MEVKLGDRLWRFHGGLKLEHFKQVSIAQPLEFAGVPPRLILPLKQHQGAHAVPVVAVGQSVAKGQLLAGPPAGEPGAAIHAPAAGRIEAIEPRPVITIPDQPEPCIEIATEAGEEEQRLSPIEDWQSSTPQSLQQRIREAGIVGLGGAVFPTYIKSAVAEPIDLLVINGAECEPWISCDEMLMRNRPQALIEGAGILARAIQARQVVIAIEDRMAVVEQVLQESVAELAAEQIQIIKVPTIYPEGGERQLIQVLTGLEVPAGGIPPDIGIVCLNVGTAAAVAEAVVDGRPLTSRIVTVTGAGIREPRNLEVLIGTPVAWLVERAGGYTDDIRRLVMGGPMMGLAMADDQRPITKASNCILGLVEGDLKPSAPELPCIRCMECVRVCPAQLLPQQLYWHIRAEDFEEVDRHDLFDCIECGCCAQVCPSQLPLVDYYRYAKSEMRVRVAERAKAARSRERFDARQARLEQAQAERAQRLDAKREALKTDDRRAAIAAAVARAKAAKQSDGNDDETL